MDASLFVLCVHINIEKALYSHETIGSINDLSALHVVFLSSTYEAQQGGRSLARSTCKKKKIVKHFSIE